LKRKIKQGYDVCFEVEKAKPKAMQCSTDEQQIYEKENKNLRK
jgi:hypothetical protein